MNVSGINLRAQFDCVKSEPILKFDPEEIVQILVSDEYNVDVNKIITTNNAVVVNMDRAEYTKKRLGNLQHKFDIKIECNKSTIAFIEK